MTRHAARPARDRSTGARLSGPIHAADVDGINAPMYRVVQGLTHKHPSQPRLHEGFERVFERQNDIDHDHYSSLGFNQGFSDISGDRLRAYR